jgi:hypothetical protein
MRVRVLRALPAVVAASLALAPPAASAAGVNAATTQAYLQANSALVRVVRSHLASAKAASLRILAQVQQECPRAGANSPQDAESTQMSDEVIGAIVIASAQPDLQAVKAFIRSVSHLSWSSRALTNAVHAYARHLQTLIGVAPPNLCGEVKAWAANGFSALPASTVAFVAKFMPAWVALGSLPAGLAHFESMGARALAQSCKRLELLITEAEVREVVRYGEIMNALEVQP